MQVLIPRLVAVLGSHSIETLEAFSETALEYRFGRGCHLERLRNLLLAMTFEAHLKRDLLLVFVNDGDSQPETDNNEIDGRSCCGER